MPLLEIFQILVVAAVPIAGVVGFAMNLATVRKLELERKKLALEIERLKLEADKTQRVIVKPSPHEIAAVTGRGVDLNALRRVIVDNQGRVTQLPQETFACFPGDTLILTPIGEVKVSEIELGATVLAWSNLSSVAQPATVVKVIRALVEQLVIINESLELTESHHVLSKSGRSIPAGRLSLGDILVTGDGAPIPITKLTLARKSITVFNLETADDLPIIANGIVVGSYSAGAKTAA